MYLGKIKLSNATDISDIHYDNAGAHNSIYRGKYLGDSVTDEQYAAIDAGTFEDMYIGDYWTINDINWRIAGFDYYYHKGSAPLCTTHHIVIVPDSRLNDDDECMNNTDTTEGGYINSYFYSKNLDKYKTIIHTAFSSEHILSKRITFTNATTDGYPSNFIYSDSTIDLMNEYMVFGCPINQQMSYNGINVKNAIIENIQLPLFALDPTAIYFFGADYWLRDIASSTDFCCVSSSGLAYAASAGDSYGVRPSFCIY